MNKRLSPLRYPGGKAKIADFLYLKLSESKTKVLYSPYTGGAGSELAFLDSGVVQQLKLNDKDFGVYALFEFILTNPRPLIDNIKRIAPNHDD